MPQTLANPTRRTPALGTNNIVAHQAPRIGPDGAYWIVVSTNSGVDLRRSTDKGVSWTTIASATTLNGTVAYLSWAMDADGHVHVTAGTGSSWLEYYHFRFTNYATRTVVVLRVTITGQSGTGYWSFPQIIAVKVALGWAVGIGYRYWNGSSGGLYYYNLYVDTAGALMTSQTQSGILFSTANDSVRTYEACTRHNGDGFTPENTTNPSGFIGAQGYDSSSNPTAWVFECKYTPPPGTAPRGDLAWSAVASEYYSVFRFGITHAFRWTGRRLVMYTAGSNGGGSSNIIREYLLVSPVGSTSLSTVYTETYGPGTSPTTGPNKPGYWTSLSIDEDAAGDLLMVGRDTYVPKDGGTDYDLVWRKFNVASATYTGWGLIWRWTANNTADAVTFASLRQGVRNTSMLDVLWGRLTANSGSTQELNQSYFQMTQLPVVTITGPASGEYLDFTDPQPFTWTIAVDPITQAPVDGVAFRRTTSGGVNSWWNGTQWVAAETYLTDTSARTGITFPADAWGANGTSYSWAVQARNADGLSGYTNNRVVTGRAKPTAQWEEPDPDEAFPVTGPVLEWSGAAASGATLDGAQVRILTPGQYQPANPAAGTATWEKSYSTWVTSEDLPGGTLADGTAYVALLRSRQGGTQYSKWTAQSFTVSIQPVATPVVKLVVAQSGTPRLDVTLTWTRGSAMGQGYVTFQRSLDGQATWQTLATLDAGTTGDASLSYTDADLPTGQVAAYRARAVTTIGDESSASAWSPVQQAAFSVYADYLVNLVTLKSSVARLQSYDHAARPWQGEVVYPLEGDQAIILSGRQYKREGSAVAAFRTWPAALAFEEALLGINPLLWRRPVDSSGWQRPDVTIRVRPGSVRVHPADPSMVRWAACLVDFDWITQ